MAPKPTPAWVRMTLDLLRDSEPIEGALQAGAAAPRPFHGWMEFVALLEETLAGEGDDGDREEK